ncbi:MAG: DegQ family serine endoprotease [Bryobacteraceae bacterium]
MSRVMQIRRSTAIFVILIAALTGALAYSWTGARHVPIFVSTAQAATTEAFQSGTFAPVVQRAMPAVVNVSTTSKVKVQDNPLGGEGGPFDDFFRQFFGGRMPQQPRERVSHALGSGVVVSPDGYILTNNHVVDGATDIKVSFSNQKEIPAKVIGTDAASDIAVIKVDQSNLPTLPLGNSAGAQVGDIVLAIGNPFGLGQTVTMGIVSAKGRSGLGIEAVEDFIQTDAAINPGNSGGALINTRGELIGINTAIVGGQTGGNVGIGFAIPANMARNIMEQLIKTGKVQRGFIGIIPNGIAPGEEQAYGLKSGQKGVAISQVDPNTPGGKAGLQVGDVIVAVNGNPVQDENSFRIQIAGMAPGTKVDLHIVRNGEELAVPVTLGENTQYAKALRGRNGQGPGDQGGETSALAGVQVDSISQALAQKLNLPARVTGVVVTDVAEGSSAAEAGLQEGDVIELVNHRKVASPSDFDAAVKTSGNRQVLLLVYRSDQRGNGGSRFIVVPNPTK